MIDDPSATGLSLSASNTADTIAAEAVGGVAPLQISGERGAALRASLGAFISSRTLVWATGIATVLIFGWRSASLSDFDHAHLTLPFHQAFGDLLISPATRWDSVWYLGIAKSGYVFSPQTVFFPLYPGLISIAEVVVGQRLGPVAGIVISWACAVGALYFLYRLVTLEFDERLARNAVWIFAWLPVTVALSAVYSESLFLLLAIGCFYAGRRGRWALAGLVGGLAAATRNGGVLLLVPLLILYLYGPRPDREPDRPAEGVRPRYQLRPDVLWTALVPLGLLAYIFYLQIQIGQPLDPFTHQAHWGRHFIPLGGVPLGLWYVGKAIVAAIPGLDPHLAARVTVSGQMRHVTEFAFLSLGVWLLYICWKRLPLAYTAFAALSLAMAVSVPASNDPLKSLPRFTLVMFPLWIALALWATERRRVRTVIAISAPLLATSTLLFTAWFWPP